MYSLFQIGKVSIDIKLFETKEWQERFAKSYIPNALLNIDLKTIWKAFSVKFKAVRTFISARRELNMFKGVEKEVVENIYLSQNSDVEIYLVPGGLGTNYSNMFCYDFIGFYLNIVQ